MITFWFEFASTYSYIAAERLRAMGEVPPRVRWRPFLLGPILRSAGFNTSPFNLWLAKGAYMWRDLERLAAREGLPPVVRPEPFPQNGLRAARIATACADAPWLVDFACRVFEAEFADGADISSPDVLRDIAETLQLDADAVLTDAETAVAKYGLRAATVEAEALGIFGAPSITVDNELFWGQDRIADALRWANG